MRKLVSIQPIEEVQPIEGADKIVKVRIKDWWVVTQKDNNFKIGDNVIYFEIDSFLPDVPAFEFLKKGSNLKKLVVDGVVKEGIRLRTIKLRGQISQGLVLPLSEFPGLAEKVAPDTDLSELLNVFKYEPPIPAQLVGKVKGYFPGFIPKTDEERIQNISSVLSPYYVTEKLDGSSVTYFKKDGEFGACSRNLELKDGEGTQWRLAHEMDLINKCPDGFALQGELIGEGIQSNPYKLNGQAVYFYNAYNIDKGMYLDFQNFKDMIEGLGLKTVPILNDNFTLPQNVDDMLKYAEGTSALNSETQREGVVVRPKVEMVYKGSRLSFKAISNKFLLGETE